MKRSKHHSQDRSEEEESSSSDSDSNIKKKHKRKHKRSHSKHKSHQKSAASTSHSVKTEDKPRSHSSHSRQSEVSSSHSTNNKDEHRRHSSHNRESEASTSHSANTKDKHRSHSSYNRHKASSRDTEPKKHLHKESEEYEWGKKTEHSESNKSETQQAKQKPDFGLSGKLTEDTNTFNGVVIKYSEPPDARKPKRRWRLYPFKDDSQLPVLHIHRQSAFLLGRDRKVADIPVDHPSCSKQHAALQYRLTDYTRDNGTKGKRIRLYIIDLESANGTFVNNKKIESKRYIELLEKDVIKFGFSSREYVVLHEHSKDSDQDDDVQDDG